MFAPRCICSLGLLLNGSRSTSIPVSVNKTFDFQNNKH